MQSFKKQEVFNKNALVDVTDFSSVIAFKTTLVSTVLISAVISKVDPVSCHDLSWYKIILLYLAVVFDTGNLRLSNSL